MSSNWHPTAQFCGLPPVFATDSETFGQRCTAARTSPRATQSARHREQAPSDCSTKPPNRCFMRTTGCNASSSVVSPVGSALIPPADIRRLRPPGPAPIQPQERTSRVYVEAWLPARSTSCCTPRFACLRTCSYLGQSTRRLIPSAGCFVRRDSDLSSQAIASVFVAKI